MELKAHSSPFQPPTSLKAWIANPRELCWGQIAVVKECDISPMRNYSLTFLQQHQLIQLLDTYANLFTEPEGSPTRHFYHHTINLIPNQGPITVRPYRYPYVQKEEIEGQVYEMLGKGIIRPNNSAYSSPVILVKKKDQS